MQRPAVQLALALAALAVVTGACFALGLWAEPNPQAGAIFSFRLPASPD